jgi:hypothetical protein
LWAILPTNNIYVKGERTTVFHPPAGGGRAGVSKAPSARLAWIAYPLVGGLLWLGWASRNKGYISPEGGLGYALGLAGAAQLVALLGYSLRKRVRTLRHWGSLRRWFSVHMALGVLGPVCILFHCNFQLGSVNSSVALGSMLVVAGSGLAGRFLYAKIHYGLYGRRASLETLRGDAHNSEDILRDALSSVPEVAQSLERFEAEALAPQTTLPASAAAMLTIGPRSRRARRRLCAMLRRQIALDARGKPWRVRRQARAAARRGTRYIKSHLVLVRRIARFRLYERLFSLWHVLHVPLFVMMAVAAVVHVVAVHLY